MYSPYVSSSLNFNYFSFPGPSGKTFFSSCLRTPFSEGDRVFEVFDVWKRCTYMTNASCRVTDHWPDAGNRRLQTWVHSGTCSFCIGFWSMRPGHPPDSVEYCIGLLMLMSRAPTWQYGVLYRVVDADVPIDGSHCVEVLNLRMWECP